jgi:hypothetical protein
MYQISQSLMLANNALAQKGVDQFWTTDLGKFVGGFLGVLGVALLIVAGAKAFKSVTEGKIGGALKIILSAGAVAAVLISPSLLTDIAGMMGTLWGLVINMFTDMAG